MDNSVILLYIIQKTKLWSSIAVILFLIVQSWYEVKRHNWQLVNEISIPRVPYWPIKTLLLQTATRDSTCLNVKSNYVITQCFAVSTEVYVHISYMQVLK